MVSTRVPEAKTLEAEELIWKNTWNWNLCDAAFGHLILDIKEGRVSAELKSQGTSQWRIQAGIGLTRGQRFQLRIPSIATQWSHGNLYTRGSLEGVVVTGRLSRCLPSTGRLSRSCSSWTLPPNQWGSHTIDCGPRSSKGSIRQQRII